MYAAEFALMRLVGIVVTICVHGVVLLMQTGWGNTPVNIPCVAMVGFSEV